MHAKTEKVKEQRAIRVAMDMVTQMEKENTWNMITRLIGLKSTVRIAAAIEPNVKDDSNLLNYFRIYKRLDAEGKQLFDRYDNAWDDLARWREVSAFYLGYATALRLGKRADILTLIRGAKADAETTLKGNFDG
jgi:hypothetical protein